MPTGELEFCVLGRVSVVRGGSELALGARRQRLVLACLICEAGTVVPAERLVDEIWGELRPATGTGPLRTYIWGLRRLLGPGSSGVDGDAVSRGVLVSRDTGYLLDIDQGSIDSVRFERVFADARADAASGRPGSALSRLGDALELWRGPAFGDLATEPAIHDEVLRLDQLLRGAKELHAELVLVTGHAAEAAVELDALTRAHPAHERLWAMLMLALYRSGRQGDALRCYQSARAALAEHLGLEPGTELQHLEQAVLRHDPTLHMRHWPGLWVEEHRPAAVQPPEDLEASAAGRDAALPAPAASDHTPLPRRLTSLVGRRRERAVVAELVDRSRLVTLAGSGGCGKTRLALAVAEDVSARFPGGVWFVDLSTVTDPDLVTRVLAESLGEQDGRADRLDHVCRRIADDEVLLLLDNCEHLVEAVAEVAEQLLTSCAALRILATSREELRVGAEMVFRVPGLELPPADREDDRTSLLAAEAVQLFVERGRAVLAEFAPSGEALGAVAQVCRRLDGIPLAIELAAALVGSIPVADLAERLDDRLSLLTTGRRPVAARHRTLRATFDWSFDLLDASAQSLFARLGAFVGSFSLPAVEAVAGTPAEPLAVARGVSHLARTSMVDCVSGSAGVLRYRLQETIRQYAGQHLDASEDAAEVRHRHARYFADLAIEAERHVHGPDASAWLERVMQELPNLRAASAWAFSHDDLETGMRLAGSLHWFFARMALLDEAARWLDTGLERKGELPAGLRLKALTAASNVAFTRGELGRAGQFGEESIALARQLGQLHELAIALMVRGASAVWAGDPGRADECFREADDLSARLHDSWGRAWMLTCWSVATHYAGDTESARRQIEHALDLFDSVHDLHGRVLPLVNLALFSLEEGRVGEARDMAGEALRIAIRVGAREMQHVSLCALGLVELFAGRTPQARNLLLRSVRDFPGSQNWLILTRALEGLACLSMTAGHSSSGATLLGFSQQVRDHWHIPASTTWNALLQLWRTEVETKLGPGVFEQEIARGRELRLGDAVALAVAATAACVA